MRAPMAQADPSPPPMPPPPTPGLAAWTDEGLRGPVRLPWLPDELARTPMALAIIPGGVALGGLVVLFGASGWQRLFAIIMVAAAAASFWLERRQRAAKRARTFIAIDPTRGMLRVAHAESGLDIDLPIATLGAVAMRAFAEGTHVMLRRRDAPDVMISGALGPAAAREAAAALARRLGIPCAADPPVPVASLAMPVPDAPVAMADPLPETPGPPHAQRIALCPDPAAAGRETLWFGGFVVLCGLIFLLMSDAPALMRWGGVVFVVLGLAITRLRQRWEAAAHEQALVVDHLAGTVTLQGLTQTSILRTRIGGPVVLQLAAVRRLVVISGDSGAGVAIDLMDRPRVMLAGGRDTEVEALAQRVAAVIGCPVEEDR